MATKDINGEVIEGIGMKPDIYVTSPTDAELACRFCRQDDDRSRKISQYQIIWTYRMMQKNMET